MTFESQETGGKVRSVFDRDRAARIRAERSGVRGLRAAGSSPAVTDPSDEKEVENSSPVRYTVKNEGRKANRLLIE